MAQRDRSLQWLLQAGKSPQAQVYTSDQLYLSVESCLGDFGKYCVMGGAGEFYCLFGEVHLLPSTFISWQFLAIHEADVEQEGEILQKR